MVVAYHIILTGYGHWLPNDPRGSLSRELREAWLAAHGEMHHGRKAIQPSKEELRGFHERVEPHLKHRVLWFDPAKRQAVAEAFAQVVEAKRYTCYACAVLSNHAHIAIRKHRDRAEDMIAALMGLSKSALRAVEATSKSLDGHPIWSDDFYKKYLSTPEDVMRTIQYIEENPIKAGLPRQEYEFVQPYRNEWFRA